MRGKKPQPKYAFVCNCFFLTSATHYEIIRSVCLAVGPVFVLPSVNEKSFYHQKAYDSAKIFLSNGPMIQCDQMT